MLCHMVSWEQYYIEHYQGDKWSRKKRDGPRFRVNGKLRRWLVLLDNSQYSAAKKWLNNKIHLTINTIKLRFVKKTITMLYPLRNIKKSRAIVRVTPKVLSIKRLTIEQGRILKRE